MEMEEEEKKKKELGEDTLSRSVQSDVSVYKQNENPSPGVYKKNMARTIVPKDSEADQELGSQDKMAGEPTQYMAGGGFVKPEDESVLLGGLTPGTSQQQLSQLPPPPPQRMPPMPPQQAAPAPMAPPMPMGKSPMKLPGMPPSVTPDDFQNYLAQQKQSLNKYGPEDQMALQNQTLKERNSLGSRLTSGAKGFADALMMGVAGAGNPGWQNEYENRQDRMAAEKMGTLQKANEGNIQRTKMGMELDMSDPKSPASQAYRESFMPVFDKMGYPADKLKNMSASQIGTIADLAIKHGDTEAQLELKKAMMEADNSYKKAMLGFEGEKAKAGIQMKKEENQQGALKQLAGMPWYSRIIHPGIASELEKQSGLGEDENDLSKHMAGVAWAKANPNDPRSEAILKKASAALGGVE